jgi:uncharacterized protein (DUF1684 family)
MMRPFQFAALTILLLFSCIGLRVHATTEDAAYRALVEKWRADYEADLKSDKGWLTISGLFWLHDGENHFGTDPKNVVVMPAGSAPPDAGYFDYRDGKIIAHIKPASGITVGGKQIETLEMRHDNSADRLVAGDVALWVHASGDRMAIRMSDKNSKLRTGFTGLRWFPIDEKYRVIAQYTSYPTPKQTPIKNLAGDSLALPIAGYVTFTLDGENLRLEAMVDDKGALSFVFRDGTSGKETYGASRFLDTDAVKDGKVVLDFNEAYNPPCAYNPYTTCPLPPPENRLTERIPAGEMAYHH